MCPRYISNGVLIVLILELVFALAPLLHYEFLNRIMHEKSKIALI